MPRARRMGAVALGSLAAVTAAFAAAAPAVAQEPPPPPPPCSPEAEACVDLATEQAWLLSDGVVIDGPVPIASGKEGYETPTGTFEVSWKDIDHVSEEYDDAPMPFSVFFTDQGHAFHAGDVDSSSHGCVRLEEPTAEQFYNELQVGEDVEITSTAPETQQDGHIPVRLGPVGP